MPVGLSSGPGHLPLSLLPKVYPRCARKSFHTCVQSCVLDGKETWSLKRENELALHQVEMGLIRWTCVVKLNVKLFVLK